MSNVDRITHRRIAILSFVIAAVVVLTGRMHGRSSDNSRPAHSRDALADSQRDRWNLLGTGFEMELDCPVNVDSEEGLALELEKSWEKYFGAPFKHVASKSTAGIEVSEWVFSVTEGHTGSTVLGDVGSYTVDTPQGIPALYMSGAFEASKGGHYDTFHDRRWCRSKQVDRANSPDVLLSGYGAARPADESMGEKKTIRANPAAAMGDGLSQGLALRHPCGIAGWWSSMRHATLYRNNTLALSGQGIGLGVGLPEGFGVGLGASARGTDTRTLESNALCRLRTQARVLVSWFLLPLYREVAASQAHRAADEREADESEDKGTDGAEAAVGAGTSTSVTVPLFMDLGHHVLFGLGGALIDVLGEEHVSFIRIRRNRFEVARSYLVEHKWPCNGDGMFMLCPWEHGSLILQHVTLPHDKWHLLNAFQKLLWMQDEVAFRWQQLRLDSKASTLEVAWTKDTESVGSIPSDVMNVQVYTDADIKRMTEESRDAMSSSSSSDQSHSHLRGERSGYLPRHHAVRRSQPGDPEPPPYEEAEQLASIPTPRVLTMMTSLTSRNRQTRGNRSTFEEAHESVAKFLESLLRRSQCPDWICWGYWWSFLSGSAHSSQVTISPSTPPESSQKTHFDAQPHKPLAQQLRKDLSKYDSPHYKWEKEYYAIMNYPEQVKLVLQR